jgi:hypothetical protein
MRTELKKHTFVIASFFFAILVNAADLRSEICQPAPDGQSCSQIICPDSNQQCSPKKIRVNYQEQTPTYTILECECLNVQTDCHININPQFEVYVTGTCQNPNYQCRLIETDNGDGTVDYECACEPILQKLDESGLPGQASNPNPTNGAAHIPCTTILSWTAGTDATSRDVYFDTVNPPVTKVIDNGTATTYHPVTIVGSKTYYWRCDEINSAGTTTGNVWSFTTVHKGDLNGDGQITTADITGLVVYWNSYKNAFGQAPTTGSGYIPEMDINCDGKITTVDISLLVIYWNTNKNMFGKAPVMPCMLYCGM